MKTIPLSKGYEAVVDDEDFDAIGGFKWTAVVTGKTVKRVYAYRRTDWNQATRRWGACVFLHRLILSPAPEMDVDHINGDTLDNRRTNLRLATRSQNLANNRRALGAVGLRGVTRTTSGEKNPFKTQFRGRFLGTFSDAISAAKAYDAAATKEFGEFAKTNASLGLLEERA